MAADAGNRVGFLKEGNVKIAYICADTGISLLGKTGASLHVRKFTDAPVECQAVAQHVLAPTLSIEPNAQKNPLLQVVRI